MNQDKLALKIAMQLGQDYNCPPEDFLEIAHRVSEKIAVGKMVKVGQAQSSGRLFDVYEGEGEIQTFVPVDPS